MPIPDPNPKETKKKYLDRCMADPVMVEEYPESKQRYTICNVNWSRSLKK